MQSLQEKTPKDGLAQLVLADFLDWAEHKSQDTVVNLFPKRNEIRRLPMICEMTLGIVLYSNWGSVSEDPDRRVSRQ